MSQGADVLQLLTILTIVAVAIVVLVLAFYLIAILLTVRRVGGSDSSDLGKLAGGLEAILRQTAPLPQDLTTINGALVALLDHLRAVDDHLTATARALGL